MSTRTELPWDLIASDIDNAIRKYCKGDYLSSKSLAKKILDGDPDGYPYLLTRKSSVKMVTARITMSCRKRGWVQWSGNGDGGRTSRVFVIPKEVRG